ncbi:hypothetical protein Tco_1252258 [Tanacetum coccineum]
MNNMTWEEIEDLKDTILSVELATGLAIFYSPTVASSEFGAYIYLYHVKDKTISLSSIPFVAGTNHVAAWANVNAPGDPVHVDCKQEKEGHKGDEIVIRSVESNHEAAIDDVNADPTILSGTKLKITFHDSNYSAFMSMMEGKTF